MKFLPSVHDGFSPATGFLVAVALCPSSVLASTTPADEPTTLELHRFHFKQREPLVLDPSRLAVLAPGGVDAGLPAILASTSPDPTGAPDWYFLAVPEEARDASTVRDLVHELNASGSVGFVTPVFLDDRGDPLLVTPDVLVQFEESVSPELAEAILVEVEAGLIVHRDWAGLPRAFLVRPEHGDGLKVLEIANLLAQRPEVRFAEPDFQFTARAKQGAPNDPSFGWCWALNSPGVWNHDSDFDMRALTAWKRTKGDPAIRVLILDSGVQLDHPDINQDPGEDFTGEGGGGGPISACDNHGTTVAGCVSAIANNSLGGSGIAPGCKIVSVRWCIARCDGSVVGQTSWLVAALDWAVSKGIQVTNMSIGWTESVAAINAKYRQTRDEFGMVHFSGSGNDGTGTMIYPDLLPWVNSVGAVGFDGLRCEWSTYGAAIDLMAPGAGLLITDRTGADGYVEGDYVFDAGTSYSAPLAAGVAALLLSADPSLTPDEVESILRGTARDMGTPGWDEYHGYGLIRADLAMARVPPYYAGVLPVGSLLDPSVRTCDRPSFSSDARYVAFVSYSPSLVSGDTNGERDVFVRNLVTGIVQRVSVNSLGSQANDESSRPSLSADGRYVAFESRATNLVDGDSNAAADVFLHDRVTGSTTLLSMATSGVQGDAASAWPSISADGTRIAFHSFAANLDPAAPGGYPLVFLRDTVAGTTILVSQSSAGEAADGDAWRPDISDDGQRVAFESYAANLFPNDVNGYVWEVFVKDLQTGAVALASQFSSGQQSSMWSVTASMSGDGNRVAFTSYEAFDAADGNGLIDVYVHDLTTGVTVGAGTDAAGSFGSHDSFGAVLSFDGRYVAVECGSALVSGDTNHHADVYRKDLETGAVVRASVGAAGQQAKASSAQPWLSHSGELLGFTSQDDLLTPGDRKDGYADVFLRDLTNATTVIVTPGS